MLNKALTFHVVGSHVREILTQIGLPQSSQVRMDGSRVIGSSDSRMNFQMRLRETENE